MRLVIRLLFGALDAACLVAHWPKKPCTNDERNIAGCLHRLRRILLYQNRDVYDLWGIRMSNATAQAIMNGDEYDYEYVEWDATHWGTRQDITM